MQKSTQLNHIHVALDNALPLAILNKFKDCLANGDPIDNGGAESSTGNVKNWRALYTHATEPQMVEGLVRIFLCHTPPKPTAAQKRGAEGAAPAAGAKRKRGAADGDVDGMGEEAQNVATTTLDNSNTINNDDCPKFICQCCANILILSTLHFTELAASSSSSSTQGKGCGSRFTQLVEDVATMLKCTPCIGDTPAFPEPTELQYEQLRYAIHRQPLTPATVLDADGCTLPTTASPPTEMPTGGPLYIVIAGGTQRPRSMEAEVAMLMPLLFRGSDVASSVAALQQYPQPSAVKLFRHCKSEVDAGVEVFRVANYIQKGNAHKKRPLIEMQSDRKATADPSSVYRQFLLEIPGLSEASFTSIQQQFPSLRQLFEAMNTGREYFVSIVANLKRHASTRRIGPSLAATLYDALSSDYRFNDVGIQFDDPSGRGGVLDAVLALQQHQFSGDAGGDTQQETTVESPFVGGGGGGGGGQSVPPPPAPKPAAKRGRKKKTDVEPPPGSVAPTPSLPSSGGGESNIQTFSSTTSSTTIGGSGGGMRARGSGGTMVISQRGCGGGRGRGRGNQRMAALLESVVASNERPMAALMANANNLASNSGGGGRLSDGIDLPDPGTAEEHMNKLQQQQQMHQQPTAGLHFSDPLSPPTRRNVVAMNEGGSSGGHRLGGSGIENPHQSSTTARNIGGGGGGGIAHQSRLLAERSAPPPKQAARPPQQPVSALQRLGGGGSSASPTTAHNRGGGGGGGGGHSTTAGINTDRLLIDDDLDTFLDSFGMN